MEAIHCPTTPTCGSRDQPSSAPLAGMERLTVSLLHDRGFVLDVPNNVGNIGEKLGNDEYTGRFAIHYGKRHVGAAN
jgi:hypothetical protein